MPQAAALFDEVCQYVRQSALLATISAVLDWDERTMMPAANAEHRADQTTLLSGMIHQRWTDETFVAKVSELAAGPLAADPAATGPEGETAVTLRRLKRLIDKKVKLPRSLVEELARTAVLGQSAWEQARRENNFAHFRPWLVKTYELKRQQAAALGYRQSPYDALLDDYEPEELTANVARVLTDLREQLVPLAAAIRDAARRPDTSLLSRNYAIDVQESFGKEAAAAIGFDFTRGRLDVTAHPFCTTLGPHDCRITTRYDGQFFNAAFFGILHEAGHGIYEQGLPPERFGLPLGEAVSLGIHESQSRLWENLVGRSRAFWQHFYAAAQKRFPAALGNARLDDFYFAVNDVRPSLIRVEADEATYNLHILIRFELEQALLSGDLPAADAPAAWNDKYRQYLGIAADRDADGVLQDVHWSAGLVGYFPTYTLGNLYASQFFAAADQELGGLHAQFARGEFQPLRHWLREKIHRHGQRYSSAELVKRVTGKELSSAPLLAHLRNKYGELYRI
jgi:carboxypeptidase Taq